MSTAMNGEDFLRSLKKSEYYSHFQNVSTLVEKISSLLDDYAIYINIGVAQNFDIKAKKTLNEKVREGYVIARIIFNKENKVVLSDKLQSGSIKWNQANSIYIDNFNKYRSIAKTEELQDEQHVDILISILKVSLDSLFRQPESSMVVQNLKPDLSSFKIIGDTLDYKMNTSVIYAQISPEEYLYLVGDKFNKFIIQRRRVFHKAYKRLKEDIKKGTVLPPITLAIKPDLVENVLDCLKKNDYTKIKEIICRAESIDILDGLQRTYILKDLQDENNKFKQKLLLEIWLEKESENLIYRLIVLNAGQKTMSLRHQVELLFLTLKDKLEKEIPNLEIYLERDSEKRTQSILKIKGPQK